MKLTLDKKGLAVWPDDIKLRQQSDGEWFDEDCKTRGGETIGDLLELARIEWCNMDKSKPIIIHVTT